jgi:hypothetical protein
MPLGYGSTCAAGVVSTQDTGHFQPLLHNSFHQLIEERVLCSPDLCGPLCMQVSGRGPSRWDCAQPSKHPDARTWPELEPKSKETFWHSATLGNLPSFQVLLS